MFMLTLVHVDATGVTSQITNTWDSVPVNVILARGHVISRGVAQGSST